MGRVIYFLLVVAIVAMWTREVSAGGYVCPKNEVYNKCGSSCPPTCETPKPTGACITACQKGCECKQGYVRSKDGYCIRPTKCIKTPGVVKGLL